MYVAISNCLNFEIILLFEIKKTNFKVIRRQSTPKPKPTAVNGKVKRVKSSADGKIEFHRNCGKMNYIEFVEN